MKKLLLFLLIFLVISCKTRFEVPEEYVPDSEVVYLKQKAELLPIEHEIKTTLPYEWKVNPEIDLENPSFLKNENFSHYLKASLYDDALTYLEVKNYLIELYKSNRVRQLFKLLNEDGFPAKPEPKELVKGQEVKEYSNSVEYAYPPVKDATIVVFESGDYQIKFKDGRTYHYNRTGYYFEEDKDGEEIYAVFPEKKQYRVFAGDVAFRQFEKVREVEKGPSSLAWSVVRSPQYVYEEEDAPGDFIFFVNEEKEVFAYTFINREKNLRFDYHIESDTVLITSANEAVTIKSNYHKYHTVFDRKSLETKDVLSLYLPEGLRITGFDKKITASTLEPAWPENYISKTIGGFTIFYTEKDEALLKKLNSDTLKKISARVKKETGLDFAPARSIILPPDLESYRKIHAMDKEERLLWYPSGYQLKDMIVMWPPSVKRYNAPEGETYFWEEEFYDILIHELTHLVVGENSGVFSAVPVWLNEGLALYVETRWSPDSKKYWELVFLVSYYSKKLLPWDDVTDKSTSEYEIDKARVFYAQSFAMVSYLVRTFGIKKVAEYVASFKTDINNPGGDDIKKSYKDNFKKIFGISWSDNVAGFEDVIPE